MTTETISMDFSNVGCAAMQAAVGSVKDGLLEAEWNRYDWLWEFLHQKRLTDMSGVEQLAAMNNAQTLQTLSTGLERAKVAVGLGGSHVEIFQDEDLPRLTNLLKEAHRLAHDPDALEKWASRPNF